MKKVLLSKSLNMFFMIFFASIPLNAIAQEQSDRIGENVYLQINELEVGGQLNLSQIDHDHYFRNHAYLEVWGYAWVSLNYQRLLPKYNLAVGGGFGPNPYTRNFTLYGDGGVVINGYFLKQFSLTNAFQLGFGVGSTYDFDGWYNEFWDPFYVKASLNSYSVSIADDRLYYGLNLYYVQWDNWSLRPSVKLGFSF